MSKLRSRLLKRVNEGKGRIIWAFDPKLDEKDPFTKFVNIFDQVNDLVAGIKFNRQLILPHGLENRKLQQIINLVNDNDIPLIMDAKINDIGYTNKSISKNYFSAGFDAVIMNPFVGKDGIQPILDIASQEQKDVIFLVYMSHPSADFGYGRQIALSNEETIEYKDNLPITYMYELFAHAVNKYNVCGGIVGGTYIDKIKEIGKIFSSEKLILSPGIGAQGGDPLLARQNGMDFAIIGRGITEHTTPEGYCEELIPLLK